MRAKTYTMASAMMVLGIVGWLVTGSQHITALIPCVFGLFYLVFATMSGKESLRMHAMHGAAVIALLGLLATARAIVQSISWIGGTTPSRPAAVLTQLIMCILSALYLLLAVRSFIAARRAR